MTDQYQSTLASRFRVITMKDGIAVTDGHGAYIRDKLGPSYYSLLDRNGDQRPFSFRDLIQEHDRLNPHAPFGWVNVTRLRALLSYKGICSPTRAERLERALAFDPNPRKVPTRMKNFINIF